MRKESFWRADNRYELNYLVRIDNLKKGYFNAKNQAYCTWIISIDVYYNWVISIDF